MNLYIETENGVTKNHPAFENNLKRAFGCVPPHWEPFVRGNPPNVGPYKVIADTPNYVKVNDVWTEVWPVRDMTAEEKAAKQQTVITAFYERPQKENWSTWTFDEVTCEMVPPVPRPEPVEGNTVVWFGAGNMWKEVPRRPTDGKHYIFDFMLCQWIESTQ